MTYRVAMAVVWPVIRWWGRLEVVGLDVVPATGPVVVMVNHDSAWDPFIVGVAAVHRRQVRALAKSSLWNVRPAGWVLNGMGQIPIARGRGDIEALSEAIEQLRAGACIGIFPEGTVSRGRTLRSRSGAGRLALAVPTTRIVGTAVTGAVDIARFPKRPRIRVTFFNPAGGQPAPGESAIAVTRRTMREVRAIAPYAVPGRAKKAARFRATAQQWPDGADR